MTTAAKKIENTNDEMPTSTGHMIINKDPNFIRAITQLNKMGFVQIPDDQGNELQIIFRYDTETRDFIELDETNAALKEAFEYIYDSYECEPYINYNIREISHNIQRLSLDTIENYHEYKKARQEINKCDFDKLLNQCKPFLEQNELMKNHDMIITNYQDVNYNTIINMLRCSDIFTDGIDFYEYSEGVGFEKVEPFAVMQKAKSIGAISGKSNISTYNRIENSLKHDFKYGDLIYFDSLVNIGSLGQKFEEYYGCSENAARFEGDYKRIIALVETFTDA